MKKLLTTLMCTSILFFTGCEWNEDVALMTTQTSGTLAATAWFAIDDPSDEVKEKMVEVIGIIKSATVEGAKYTQTVYPLVAKYIDTLEMDDFKKQLIESGAILILGAVDEIFIKNPKLSSNRELARKYVNSFCDGCMIALNKNTANKDSLAIAKKCYSLRINSRKRFKK